MISCRFVQQLHFHSDPRCGSSGRARALLLLYPLSGHCLFIQRVEDDLTWLTKAATSTTAQAVTWKQPDEHEEARRSEARWPTCSAATRLYLNFVALPPSLGRSIPSGLLVVGAAVVLIVVIVAVVSDLSSIRSFWF